MNQQMSLEDQLREMYGRVAYTHKTHEKMADGYVARYKTIKSFEIVLSALSAGSLLFAVWGDSRPATILGAVLSTLLLGLNLYFKEATLGEQAQIHAETASKLWGIRERLLSLLIDMDDGRAPDEVRHERDRLNQDLESLYKSAPRTNAKAYAGAQAALKSNEELFFSADEMNKMLPEKLRRPGHP
jgi:alpha-beta hydrolase superfamily lysophospholipase